MIVLSTVIIFLGARNLQTLRSTYQLNDIARLESPDSFRSWLVGLKEVHAEGLKQRYDLISERLLVMSLQSRRRIVSAALSDRFWDDMRLSQSDRRALIEATLAGVEKALKRAPSLGDLWLLTAKLNTRLYGFSNSVRSKLRASQIYAPREAGLVLERLKLGAVSWPLLSIEDKERFRSDLLFLENSNASRYKKIVQELKKAGVIFE